MRTVVHVWRTGNKSPRAFVALAPVKTPRHNYLHSTRKRRTQWLPSSWRVCSKPPARTLKPRSGTPPPPRASVAPIGKRKHSRLPRGLAANPLGIRNSIFRSLRRRGFRCPKRALHLKTVPSFLTRLLRHPRKPRPRNLLNPNPTLKRSLSRPQRSHPRARSQRATPGVAVAGAAVDGIAARAVAREKVLKRERSIPVLTLRRRRLRALKPRTRPRSR